jgi:hypothetical protein
MTEATERPIVGLLIAAGAVALVTLGLVLRFGLVGPPELAPLDASAQPPAELAVVTYRDRERSQCLDVVGVDGSVREVRCSLDGVGPLLGWDDRGILMIRYGAFGERVEVIDPETGEVVTTEPFDPRVVDDGRWVQAVDTERSGGTLIVRAQDRTILWQVSAPDSYWINASARDEGTGAIAMLDSAGRLLLLGEGAAAPSVWVEDLGVTFGEIVWQGTRPTAD